EPDDADVRLRDPPLRPLGEEEHGCVVVCPVTAFHVKRLEQAVDRRRGARGLLEVLDELMVQIRDRGISPHCIELSLTLVVLELTPICESKLALLVSHAQVAVAVGQLVDALTGTPEQQPRTVADGRGEGSLDLIRRHPRTLETYRAVIHRNARNLSSRGQLATSSLVRHRRPGFDRFRFSSRLGHRIPWTTLR